MRFFFLLSLIFIAAGFSQLLFAGNQNSSDSTNWAWDCIAAEKTRSYPSKPVPIIVAVIDDAFRLSHKELKDFIYTNIHEISGNGIDDEGNGYIDDYRGWDISDGDPDVSVPEGMEKVFYHGTYISSLITGLAKKVYGERASEFVKIMTVKTLSDNAAKTYIRDGYKGIEYAMNNGADIICLAWSGGNPGTEEKKIIEEANRKGILIVASAGNFNQEKILYPANHPHVMAVTGIEETLRKEKHSNYGIQADISAPAKNIKGAHPLKDNAYIEDSGSSSATALVAGCAAILLSQDRRLSPAKIKFALQNSSTVFPADFATYGGKLGAGIVNLKQALDYVANPGSGMPYFSELRPKGTINLKGAKTNGSWKIKPAGSYSGFRLQPDLKNMKIRGSNVLRIFTGDTVWREFKLPGLHQSLFVPGDGFKMKLERPLIKRERLNIEYFGETIDSSQLYCSGVVYYDAPKGFIDDGSGAENYANNSSCRWIITAPRGKKIQFSFQNIDTRPNTDFVYLFNGPTAIPENMIAKCSGQNLPPILTSQQNEVLVWFVTDASKTAEGWELNYEFVD